MLEGSQLKNFKSFYKSILKFKRKIQRTIAEYEENGLTDIYGHQVLKELNQQKRLIAKGIYLWIYKPLFYKYNIEQIVMKSADINEHRNLLIRKRRLYIKENSKCTEQ